MSRSTPSARGLRDSPVFLAWVSVALLLSAFWLFGYVPKGDDDDLLKAWEIRHFLETGDPFDRTLPGIAQPEPFVSHWPWIADAPYVALAHLLRPLTGQETALAIAFFVVPLLLFAPALIFLRRIVDALGFERPNAVFFTSVVMAIGSIGEFGPGRIDYHNLQMVLLLASVWLTLVPGRGAALANGVVVALAMAIGLELALFFALVLAIHAFEFIRGSEGAGLRLQALGAGLSVGAALLFAILLPPSDYAASFPDRFSLPQAMALTAAGISFMLVPALLSWAGWVARTAGLGACAALSAIPIALRFPESLQGPYAGLSDYTREHWLGSIGQEKSLFAHPDIVLSTDVIYVAMLLVGVLAAPVVALRTRPWSKPALVFASFALLAAIHGVLHSRYLRFMPLFAGPGFAWALYAVLPAEMGRRFASRLQSSIGAARLLPVVPGVAVTASLLVAALMAPRSDPVHAVALAEFCDLDTIGAYRWAAGSRVLATPRIGVRILSQPGASVVSIPFHRAAAGVERTYRFFDPATVDPASFAEAAQATHIAVCAWRGAPSPELERELPLAAGLIAGKAPAWLTECSLPASSALRIYRFASEEADSCPTAVPKD